MVLLNPGSRYEYGSTSVARDEVGALEMFLIPLTRG